MTADSREPAAGGRPMYAQADVTEAEVERRFTYHAPSGDAKDRHTILRADVKRFANQLLEYLPASREKSLAFTALEEASYHAHAAIAREPSLHEKS